MTLTNFINERKSLMIAAAGHGKTHAIAECVQLSPEGQCQLVLTHTHAGIASIKEKLADLKVKSKKYHLETITSFAQKYALAYCKKDDLPQVSDNAYFQTILSKALKVFHNSLILEVVKATFDGVYVDEYQDCDENQHAIIMQLAEVLPVHVLGDELQGIFGFAGRLVDFDRDLNDFARFELKKPWRWYKDGNCRALGDKILEFRNVLLSDNKHISLASDSKAGIEVFKVESEAMAFDRNYFVALRNIVNRYDSESLLILYPSYKDERGVFRGRIGDRVRIKDSFDFGNRFLLAEAIDDKSFYSNASAIDDIIQTISSPRTRKKEKKVFDLLDGLSFNKTDLKDWFDERRDYALIVKRGDNREKADKLASVYGSFVANPSKGGLLAIVNFCLNDVGMKPKRQEIVSSIKYCLSNYPGDDVSVHHSMVEMRNAIRREGRKIRGRVIGTTLLTKGLEFDNVVILDAHRFEDSKNFYVAISRACKHLIIITKQTTLLFRE